MSKSTIRTFGAAAAALTLSAGLVACGNDDENKDDNNGTETVVESVEATETASETTTVEASEGEQESDTAAAAADENGETVEVETQDGEKVLVPAGLKASMDEIERDNWGTPKSVESNDGKFLVTYDVEKNVAYSEETGGVKIVGGIANEWKNDGGLNNPIGLPTAPEQKNADDNGWTQDFQNGKIEVKFENGQWTANKS